MWLSGYGHGDRKNRVGGTASGFQFCSIGHLLSTIPTVLITVAVNRALNRVNNLFHFIVLCQNHIFIFSIYLFETGSLYIPLDILGLSM